MRGLGFINDFAFYTVAAHTAFTLINRGEIGIRHPCGVKMNGLHIQSFLDVVSVIQQTVIG